LNNYKLVVSFSGQYFKGVERQPDQRTVERDVHFALKKLFKSELLNLCYAGRTDAGVHAAELVFSFSTKQYIPNKGLLKGLNSILEPCLRVIQCYGVNAAFHARYSAISRKYNYLFTDAKVPLYLADRIVQISHSIDISSFSLLRNAIMGIHDFRGFCKKPAPDQSCVREILRVSLNKKYLQDIYNPEYILYYYNFCIVGNGFLYNMVRNILGAMMEVFKGRYTPEDFQHYIKTSDKSRFKFTTIQPYGLCLARVHY